MFIPIILLCVCSVTGSDLNMNSDFLPHQCWTPNSQTQESEELMMGDAPTHFDLNAFIPHRIELSELPLKHELDDDDGWFPPPPPPNVTEVIANNDLRAYYYYLSNPDLDIDIQEECEAVDFHFENHEVVTRHKYVFVDSKGLRIEVFLEERDDIFHPRTASDRKHKSSKNLMLSLVGGGRVRSRVKH